MYFLGHTCIKPSLCVFIRVLFLSDPTRSQKSDSERLYHVTTTTTSSFCTQPIRSVVFKRTARIGYPHTWPLQLSVPNQSDPLYSKGPLRLVTLSYTRCLARSLGSIKAREARSELSVSTVHSVWKEGQLTDGNPRGNFQEHVLWRHQPMQEGVPEMARHYKKPSFKGKRGATCPDKTSLLDTYL